MYVSTASHRTLVRTPRRSQTGDDAGPSRLDLSASRLSLLWTSHSLRGCFGYGTPFIDETSLTEEFTARLTSSPTVTLRDAACNTSTKTGDSGPALLDGSGLTWMTSFEQVQNGEVVGTSYLRSIIGGRPGQARIPVAQPTSLTRDGDDLYVTERVIGATARYVVTRYSLERLAAKSEPFDPDERPPPHP